MILQSTVNQFRRALLARDQAAANAMLRAYAAAWRAIKRELDSLLSVIEARQLAGEFVNITVVLRETQLTRLLNETQRQINLFARLASQRVRSEQQEAVNAARANTAILFEQSVPSNVAVDATFSNLPKQALQELVGSMGDDSPLAEVFARFGPGARRIIEDELAAGLASGRSLRATANEIRDQLGGFITSALRIARTETLRAYRTASIQTYQANSDVVTGWRWTASLSLRTCAMCLAMDGSIHPTSEEFDSHPMCRCTPVPVTKTLRELGAPVNEIQRDVETGAEWFARQPAKQQQEILGGAAYRAYKAGQITLQDLIGMKFSTQWGRSRYRRSLTEILGPRAEEFKKAA